MRLGGRYAPVRKLAIGKAFYVKELRGRLYACKWPKARGRVKHPTTLAQMEKFRQANWLCKYTAPTVQVAYRELVRGTQLLPRDMMIAAMYGRGFTWWVPGSRRRYPVTAVRDLSDNLDILGGTPGDILARGPDRWQASRPSAPGQVLLSQDAGAAPTWSGINSLTGLWQQTHDETLAAGIGLNVYKDLSIADAVQELEFTIHIPVVAAGTLLACRISGIATANYFYCQQGVNSGNATTSAQQSNATEFRLKHSSTALNAGRSYIRGRVFQNAPSDNAGFWAEASWGGSNMLKTIGNWTFGGSAHISKISFASVAGAGLPAGTRFITRATFP